MKKTYTFALVKKLIAQGLTNLSENEVLNLVENGGILLKKNEPYKNTYFNFLVE